MDYKKIIDDLSWVQSPEEIALRSKLRAAVKACDWGEHGKLQEQLKPIETKFQLREAGLEHPVQYAIIARTEYEMLKHAEQMGPKLEGEFNLHPAGQGGIGLDWVKINESGLYIPRHWLKCEGVDESHRAIFGHDEANCIGYGTNADEIKEKVLFGPDNTPQGRGTSEGKIKALCSEPNFEWVEAAKEYVPILFERVGTKYLESIKSGYAPVFEALLSAYRSEMK
ncbi:MAG: hypothetical protein KAS04_02740 [Candidatus Aenigmarchaeota archaeon]|nr:hypothetical protein [Candidatus Aenigmarchaeota archaeon]